MLTQKVPDSGTFLMVAGVIEPRRKEEKNDTDQKRILDFAVRLNYNEIDQNKPYG